MAPRIDPVVPAIAASDYAARGDDPFIIEFPQSWDQEGARTGWRALAARMQADEGDPRRAALRWDCFGRHDEAIRVTARALAGQADYTPMQRLGLGLAGLHTLAGYVAGFERELAHPDPDERPFYWPSVLDCAVREEPDPRLAAIRWDYSYRYALGLIAFRAAYGRVERGPTLSAVTRVVGAWTSLETAWIDRIGAWTSVEEDNEPPLPAAPPARGEG